MLLLPSVGLVRVFCLKLATIYTQILLIINMQSRSNFTALKQCLENSERFRNLQTFVCFAVWGEIGGTSTFPLPHLLCPRGPLQASAGDRQISPQAFLASQPASSPDQSSPVRPYRHRKLVCSKALVNNHYHSIP